MSGQYKIRRDSQDDFSDIKAGYKIAKKGGCWENIKSCLGLLLLLFICGIISSLMTGNASAQSNNSCFPHETLYTTEPIDMKGSDSRFSATRGKTKAFQVYRVLEAKKDSLFSSCWVRISGGWMLRRPTGSVIRPESPTQQSTSKSTTTSSNTTSSTASSKCYAGSKAYITGSMNIRSGPSTSNSKVGSARAIAPNYFNHRGHRDLTPFLAKRRQCRGDSVNRPRYSHSFHGRHTVSPLHRGRFM